MRSYIANSPLDPVLSQLQSYADVGKELRFVYDTPDQSLEKYLNISLRFIL